MKIFEPILCRLSNGRKLQVSTFVFFLVSLSILSARADIQELYPDNNVSGKKVVLFEARKGIIELGNSGLVGHAFVKLGTELDNGLVLVHSFFGYYPSEGTMYQVKLIFSTKAEIKFEFPSDLKSDVSQKYYISDDVYRAILAKEAGYLNDNPNYSLLLAENCVTFVKEIAAVAGLRVPEQGFFSAPGALIDILKSKNGSDPNVLMKMKKTEKTPRPTREGSEDVGQKTHTAQELGVKSAGDLLGTAIDMGIPVVNGGLTASESSGGNISFGWPTVTIVGGGGSRHPPRCCLQPR